MKNIFILFMILAEKQIQIEVFVMFVIRGFRGKTCNDIKTVIKLAKRKLKLHKNKIL